VIFSEKFIEKVRESTDIVEIIGLQLNIVYWYQLRFNREVGESPTRSRHCNIYFSINRVRIPANRNSTANFTRMKRC
jgi:hypothetical protein